jgi:uncharacterized membrane protein YtjA (UPF0391 family)
LFLSLAAALFGFGGALAVAPIPIAQILFYVFGILFILAILNGRRINL